MYVTGLNLTLSVVLDVDPVPLTAGLHAMTSGDIIQDTQLSVTLDLRDKTNDQPIENITWRVRSVI